MFVITTFQLFGSCAPLLLSSARMKSKCKLSLPKLFSKLFLTRKSIKFANGGDSALSQTPRGGSCAHPGPSASLSSPARTQTRCKLPLSKNLQNSVENVCTLVLSLASNLNITLAYSIFPITRIANFKAVNSILM